MQGAFGQQGAVGQPGHGWMVATAIVVVLVVLAAIVWWMKRTRGGRRTP